MEQVVNQAEPRNAEKSKAKGAKRFFRKFLKYSFYGTAALIIALVIANQIYKYTGHDDWKFAMEKDGIKIYTMKKPGNTVMAIKATYHSKYTMNHYVAALLDLKVETCAEWAPICTDLKTITPWDVGTLTKYFINTYEIIKPIPPLEFMLRAKLSQDKDTKAVTCTFQVFPDYIPHNEGKTRLRHMTNIWKWTPVASGGSDVEFVQDADLSQSFAGFLPNALFNMIGVDGSYTFLHDDLPKIFEKEKYYNVRFDTIEEYIERLKTEEAALAVQ